VGTNADKLSVVNLTGPGGVGTFDAAVYANTIGIFQTTGTFPGNVTGAVRFLSAGGLVNLTGAGGSVTFDESVVATNIGINGAGATGTFLGNVTAPVNFGANGTMVLGNGTTLAAR
jgi:hypothetical protein